jgi:hypothetical protein
MCYTPFAFISELKCNTDVGYKRKEVFFLTAGTEITVRFEGKILGTEPLDNVSLYMHKAVRDLSLC